MTISLGKLTIMAALLSASSLTLSRETGKSSEIEAALSQIRDAAIASKPEMAASLFAEDLALISQSGKLYGKEAALFDLSNPFIAWDNSELVMREQGDNAIVTFVNSRTRTGMVGRGRVPWGQSCPTFGRRLSIWQGWKTDAGGV